MIQLSKWYLQALESLSEREREREMESRWLALKEKVNAIKEKYRAYDDKDLLLSFDSARYEIARVVLEEIRSDDS